MKITEIDKNFAEKTLTQTSGTEYKIPCKPFALYGCHYDERYGFIKIDPETAKQISDGVAWGSRCTAGVRLTFSTDSHFLGISAKLYAKCLMNHMPFVGSAGFTLCETIDEAERFIHNFVPDMDVDNSEFSSKAQLCGDRMRDYVLYFPLYSGVERLSIELESGAKLEEYKKYEHKKRIMYYGSSITQGGCASRADNCYQSLVSEWTNTDYIIYGFSGNAKGEHKMAEILRDTPCDLFVCDYDHNAPDAEHLRKTHLELYKTFRSKKENANIPVVFLSKPDGTVLPDFAERYDIIKATYDYALSVGDKNVRIIRGTDLFPEKLREHCTVDGTHPTDLGFWFMAKGIYEVVSGLLK